MSTHPPLKTVQADNSAVLYTPKDELEELRKKQLETDMPTDRPNRLPISRIHMCEALFQPRRIEEKHISDLVRAIRSSKELESVIVIQVGEDAYLIDGHHRIAAYQEAKVSSPIPVRYFSGTLDEAVLEAGRANAKAKLPMDTRQRMNYAWRLVLLGGYSKAKIVEAACISDGQVARMRKAAKDIGKQAYTFEEWWQAQRLWQDQETAELTDEEHEARLEAIALQQADKMAKTFSSKLSNNLSIAARTFDIYFGRRLPDLVHELQDYIPDDDEDDDPF